jgi:ubiquinone/menaquinone biosynthesis C-methylase UbiE
LEVGPGAGRWTDSLEKIADRLILTDITERCIEMCRERFSGSEHIEYHVNDGATLPFIPSNSLDAVFSFDVFVHVAPRETRSYLLEFARCLKPGGIALIHHPNVNLGEGWRSGVTTALFDEMLAEAGLRLERRFDSWGPDNQYSVRNMGDQITVFTRP